MDWRSPLRRWVGEDDSLNRVQIAVLRLIDPVEAHMRSNFAAHDVPRRGRRRRRGVAYAPITGSEEGTRPRPPERPSAGDLDEVSRAEDALLERHRGWFEAEARDLLDGRDVVIETNRGTVRARLTRYRKGAVFENWRTAPDHEGNGIARIEPSETNLVPLLVDHLANAVLDLGTDAEPR